jgi:hypothetical protein
MGKILVPKRKAVRWVIVALVVGFVLIALGAWMIYSARRMNLWLGLGYEGYYPDWDTNHLLIGIPLTLVGTAASAASLTYLYLDRKM